MPDDRCEPGIDHLMRNLTRSKERRMRVVHWTGLTAVALLALGLKSGGIR